MPRKHAKKDGEGRKRRLGKGWIVLIVVVALLIVLWIASEIAIPAVASSYIKGRIKKKYPDATNVTVSVSAFPAIRLAFKDYSSLTVKVSGVKLENINFSTILLTSKKWPLGRFTAVVTPNEILRFFSVSHSYVLNPQVALNQGKIQVSGDMNIGYATPAVVATGKLQSRTGGKQIYFVPDNITASGISNKQKAIATVQGIMTNDPVFTIRENLPFTVTSIVATNSSLTVRGTVNLEKALNVKL